MHLVFGVLTVSCEEYSAYMYGLVLLSWFILRHWQSYHRCLSPVSTVGKKIMGYLRTMEII